MENVYFDEEFHRNLYVIERTNAWLDGFKGFLVRYEKKLKVGWLSTSSLSSLSYYEKSISVKILNNFTFKSKMSFIEGDMYIFFYRGNATNK